jgi:aromatic-L-amino-acid decarboxylase
MIFYFCSESSWISWPLAFLFNSTDDGNSGKNDVMLRFRHLDVNMGSSRRNSASGNTSPSPDGENGILSLKSPKKSPQLMRKRGTSPNMSANGNSS